MGLLKDAIWLAKMEYKHHWTAAILTFLFSLFIGMAIGLLLSGSESIVLEVNSTSMNRFFLDFIFIGMAPSLATLFLSKPYISYQVAKDDPYGKRMAVLRSLPIPVSVLALSRTILVISNVVVMSIALYGAMSAVVIFYSNSFLDIITMGEWVTFIFVWVGFMLAAGGINPYIEYGTSGKFLHVFPFVYMALFIMVEAVFYLSFKQAIVETSFELVKNIGWPLAVASILIGSICCYGWNNLLKNRLQNRDYL